MALISKIPIKEASITRSNLLEFLQQIASEQTLIAPVKNDVYGDVDFSIVEDSNRICFCQDNTVSSPKEFFFPNCECMFTYEGSDHNSTETQKVTSNIVLFGIKSCDVKAIELLDSFYQRDFEDNYYLDKRRKSVLISIACSELGQECFCTSTRTGPVLDEGFDIQLIPMDGHYAVQIGSESGADLFERYKKFFSNGKKSDVKEFVASIKKAKPEFDLDNIYKRLKTEQVQEAFWKDIAERCQSCGLCLFLCPTCSCFTVSDKVNVRGQEQRVRQWDGCYFRGFTRIAGGDDIVRDNQEMVKRKYYHKLVQQIDEFGPCGCVGCGRCNRVCVGNVNWLENLKKIDQGA